MTQLLRNLQFISANRIIMKKGKTRLLRRLELTNTYKLPVLLIVICFLAFSLYWISVLNSQNNTLADSLTQREKEVDMLSKKISEKSQEISMLISDIQLKTEEINAKNTQIEILESTVDSLEFELGEAEENLEETTRLLDVAKEYEERVQQGTDLNKAYILLRDYDKTAGIVEDITDMSFPENDQELWERGKDIYDWLGIHYDYCSDKGFCIKENYCAQIQFFSPDELLYYGSQDVLCGDCDDKAQLFAGMMYASNVPYNKVRVVCGKVPGGGHCWNELYLNNNWYRIDPVCSNPGTFVLEQFGLGFLSPSTYPSGDYRNVDCFGSYETDSWYDTEGFHSV